ncbi:Hypothetical protein, putative [Bodo saltans]|uniref:Uncharacterized protein n=1 Tax=Bodo saltans TaxID=75058 RepID=A0A0S4KPT9_BODSA|nr:Hypothetical protein, putative [Bodo saltans]|eukprot:CUI14936.1 Hypothetical protein, putative [Bodo saltans]
MLQVFQTVTLHTLAEATGRVPFSAAPPGLSAPHLTQLQLTTRRRT